MNGKNEQYLAGLGRICKRCLIPEFIEDKDKFILNYIEGIAEEERTGGQEYEQRLEICEDCEHLMSGVCRQCGCFAAVRAAVKKNYCPDIRDRWKK